MASSSFGYFPEYSGVTPQGLSHQGSDPGVTTVTTIAVAGAQTYTAAQLLGGMILHDPSGGAATGTTATAALIVTALNGAANGTSFDVVFRNTADAAETITVAGGTGVTISGTATVAQNNSKTFRFVVTESASGNEAITAYSLGSAVF